MRLRRLSLAVAISLTPLIAQPTVPTSPASVNQAIYNALSGSWAGVLEYRDYALPATSTARVRLPTWLTIESAGDDLKFSYVYDDGPNKIVTDAERVHIDAAASTYTVRDPDGKLLENYSIAGAEQLKAGRGTLLITGKGMDNNLPVDVRLTLRIGRNILELTREIAATSQPFVFRHAYTLTGIDSRK